MKNIKTDVEEKRCEDVAWINFPQDGVQEYTINEHSNESLGVHKRRVSY